MNQEPANFAKKVMEKTRCPKCDARTKAPCVDEFGVPLSAIHGERLQKYARHRKHVRVMTLRSTRDPEKSDRLPLEERETWRRKVRSAVSCPYCGAEVGDRCFGRGRRRRLSVHMPRIDAFYAIERGSRGTESVV